MKKNPIAFVALLRGINVGGNNPVPMAELCSLCTKIGWCDVQSYIQSGNLVFTSTMKAEALEKELERAIERRFQLSISVVVRAAVDWNSYIKRNPFPDESKKEPNLVMLALSKALPKPDAVKALQ